MIIVLFDETVNKKDACNTLLLGNPEENATLVSVRDSTTLYAKFYNCRKPGHLVYNCYEACHNGTYSLQVIHCFT